jgi:F-type H+-transporting ATPase subunit b
MLEVNPGLIVWTIATFVLLAFVLGRYAWKPMLDALRRREEGIHSAIERAETAKKEAEHLLEQHRSQLARAEEESRRILGETRALADKLKGEVVEKANQQARIMIDQAKNEIERDKDAAIIQLRSEVADLAVEAAGKILGETLDAARHKKIVDEILKTLPKN